MSKVVVVLCTFPNHETAENVARAVVGEELAACANLVNGVRSIYRWEGEVRDDAEVLGMFKTTDIGFSALERRLAELHPYECPEIIATDVNHGHTPYLEWVRASVAG